MIQKMGLWVCLLGMAVNATAAQDSKFACSNVGGVEEWTIYVDLEKKLAGFFDNDSTEIVKFKQVYSLESMPPQTLYIFEGKKLRIGFNETRRTAYVVLYLGTRHEKTFEAQDGCEANSRIDLTNKSRSEKQVYGCTREDGVINDWFLSIDLDQNQAKLWDDEIWSTFILKYVYERFPPTYLFEGKKAPKNKVNFTPTWDGSRGLALYWNETAGTDKGIRFECVKE